MSEISQLSRFPRQSTTRMVTDPFLDRFERARGSAVDLLRRNLKEFGLNNSQFFVWAHRPSAHHPVAIATLVNEGKFSEVLSELREQNASGELAKWLKQHPR